ncbi:MAG: ribonuclease E inhibitor RraB [Erysipelotrichaceae bacterium]|nr:ribonuclease E inhibitor RraB [Erysipelotrichaceae bacterium]
MKKTIPLLAVLGSAAAFAVYKLKQEEKKKIMALDQDLLVDETSADEEACDCDEEDEEADASKPKEIKVETGEKPVYSHPEYPNVSDEEYDDISHMNEEAIGKLHEQGDVNENERPIQHTVTFKNQEDMENFKNKVVNKGFVVTKGVSDFELTVLHISSIDSIKLMENVLFIADQAYANHGSYKGWQSKISY